MAKPITAIGGVITSNALNANIDALYGTYDTVADAINAIGQRRLSASCVGLTVGIKNTTTGEVTEYWVQPITGGYGLVKKGAATTDYNDLENKPAIKQTGGTEVPLQGTLEVDAETATGNTAGVSLDTTTQGTIKMKFSLPKGADGQNGAPGHNPCLGRFTTLPTLSPNPFADARDGDYIYLDTTDPQTSDPVTYIYHFNGSVWDAQGTVVDVSNLTFGTGQSVPSINIKDRNGSNAPSASGVLSAEAGRQLSEEIAAINKPDKTVMMDQEGYIKWETGNSTVVSRYRCSDFVEMSGYTGLKYTLNAIGTVAANIAFYDADKVFLPEISVRGNSAVRMGDIDLSAAAYEQAVYVRVSESVVDVSGTVVLTANSIIPQLMAEVESLEQDVDGLNDKVDGIVVEDVSADITINGYIKWETGLKSGTSEKYKSSDYIGLSDYTDIEYRVGGAISSVAAVVAFYDADKGYLQEVSVRGNTAVRTGKIDLADAAYAAARFVRVCAAESLTDAYARLYNRETLSYEVSEIKRRVNQLDQTGGGIKVLIFGDSITDNMGLSVNDTTNCSESCYFRTTDYVNGDGQTVVYKKWPQLLAEFFETNEVRNYARSGASYKDQPSYTSGENRRRSLSYQITVAENDLSNPNGVFPTEGAYVPDVVVFALGTNDGNPNDTFDSAIAKIVYNTEDNVNVSVDIESTLAALDKSKFNEAVMYAFLKVKSMFPTALFMCLLPIQRWANTAVMGGLHESLKSMANYFSIPVIDGAFEMGVLKALEVDSGIGALLKDGLHPNEKGQNVMARMMISQIKSRFVSMSGMNS